MTPQERLAALLEDAGDAEEITVRVALLRALVNPVADTPDPGVAVDLTAEEVGAVMHRDPSVVRQWCRAGCLPGAYKLAGREWRIPRDALAAFQRHQRAIFARAA